MSDDGQETERRVREALGAAVERARRLGEGAPASYIPELATVDPELTSAAVTLRDGVSISAGDAESHRFTLQSVSKVVLLAGLLEELGPERVFSVVGAEPSGEGFASLARLETHGPHPPNPLVNAGAIALCSLIPGELEAKLSWLDRWVARLCGKRLYVNQSVLGSEERTGDRNRAIAYFLRNAGVLESDVADVLRVYFTLCSFEARVEEAAHAAAVLAAGGSAAGAGTPRLLSRATVGTVLAQMATCGMYDESGSYLRNTGLPAKSGVSGVIIAVAPGRAGIAVASPRVNTKGGSVRGHAILESLSRELGWHFALPAR